MNYFIASLDYVISDNFFWLAMAFTTTIGIFVGAVVYDGILRQVKKGVLVLFSYAFILLLTNISRITPIIVSGNVKTMEQPLAGSATILLVTIFYVLGMWLGVQITNFAHKGKEI